MKFLAWFGQRILRNRPYSWFILGFLLLVAVIGFANADTLVPPIPWTMPATVIHVTPADVPTSKAWQDRVYRLCPAEGCVVRLAPGTYAATRNWKGKAGLLVVEGEPGLARPLLISPIGCGGDDNRWAGVVLRGLDFAHFDGGESLSSLPDCDLLVYQDLTLDDCVANGVHLSNSDRTRFEIERMTVSRCGRGNTQHNLYIGRIPSARIVELTSWGSKGSHALKSIARTIELRDSWLGTVAPGQSLAEAGPYVSTTLADLVACGQSLLENVTLDHWQTDDTGNQVLAYRNRNSILGCDEPPYGDAALWDTRAMGPAPAGYEGPLEPVGDNDNLRGRFWARIDRAAPFWSPGFWTAPNPAEFRHTIRNVRFIERGQANRAIAITMEGTAPVIVSRAFGPALRLPQPVGWFERAWFHDDGSTYEGPFRARLISGRGEGGE